MNKKHIATWVYYTYRDHKDLPAWLQMDLDYAKVILGIEDEKKDYEKKSIQGKVYS